MMVDLVEFLRARLVDDERLARVSIDEEQRYNYSLSVTEDGLAIPPHRVLAEVEAKRCILDKFEQFNDRDEMPQAILTLHWTLRVLAMPYAGHPEFNPAWGVADGSDNRLS